MPKQLNVNLGFSADTSQAKKQIQELRQSLQDIAKLPGKASSLFDDTDIKNASKAALELQQHLNAAVNVNTGKLDLSRLSTSLKAANRDLNEYYSQLTKIGPQGQEAFLGLAKSISTAEAPVTRVNAKLAEIGTVLKNTARWQISSSILHGFMGTLQGAYGYAQDLNESLNNIRIVTGQSVDEMAKFAEKANASAKTLSTTTTAYTDAALIFYQQGLSGKDVTDRTDTVIKMANVTKQSAEEVSSYMTAIWNNFDNGSVSLEHYADVITALGATTASSSAEIAEGLSKFASVADTIGLSYDYATSILSALVANTRQSADVIGTSLKTILARLQSVKLGETLDDGVELTKYTAALNTIGVSVLDLNDNLRDADDILDDTAAKWDTLNKAQQDAVAQTVAGTRQYSQFIAMMENWGDVEKNLQTAQGAEGALQNQADIYAESWEAAQKRVKAAAQGVYQSILDDKFFIGLNNGFAKVVETIGEVVKGLGGMKGVLSSVGSIFLGYYAQKMPEALNNLKQNFMVFIGQATKLMLQTQQETAQKLAQLQNDSSLSLRFKAQAEGIARVNEMQQKLILNTKNMSESEQADYRARIQNVQAIYEEVTALAKEAEELNKVAEARSKQLASDTIGGVTGTYSAYNQNQDNISALENRQSDTEEGSKEYEAIEASLEKLREKEVELQLETDKLNKAFGFTASEVEEISLANGKLSPDNIKKIETAVNGVTESYRKQLTTRKTLDSLFTNVAAQSEEWKKQAAAIGNDSAKLNELKANMKAYVAAIRQMGKENNFDVQESALSVLESRLDSSTSTAKECASAFEYFQQKLNSDNGADSLNGKINVLDGNIEKLEARLSGMGVTDTGLRNLQNDAEAAAQGMDRLNDSTMNARGQANQMPQSTFKMSTAMTQFASAAMATYTVIQSVTNAFQVFGDDSSTAIEKIGAAVSVLMGVIMAFSAISSLAATIQTGLTATTWGQALANKGLAISILGVEATLSPLLVIVLAIMAAMAALILIVVGLSAAFAEFKNNSPEGKLAKSTAAAKELSEKLDTAKQSAEDLKNAFNNYDSVVEQLENCTRGTDEWKQALEDVNNQVLDILNEYPELLEMEGAITRNADGMLVISDDAKQKMQDLADSRVNTLQAASLGMNNQVKQDQLAVDVSDFGWSHTYMAGSGDMAYQYNPMNVLDDHLEELVGLTGTEFTEKLTELLEGPAKSAGMSTSQFDAMIKSLSDCQPEIEKLGVSAQEAALAWENTANIIAAQNLGDDYDSAETEMASEAYEQKYEERKEYWEKQGKDGIAVWSEYSSNSGVKEIWDAYNKAMGTSYKMDTSNGVTGTDSNRAFQYLDDGELKKVTLDEVASTIAAAEALESLGQAADEAKETLANMDKAIGDKDIANGMRNFITTKNFSDMTEGDLARLKEEATNTTIGDVTGTEAYLDKLFGDGEDGKISNETAAKYGYESAEEMVAAFEQGISDYETSLEEIGKNWLNAVNESFSQIDTSALSLNQQRILGDAMNEAFANSGDEGLEAFENIVKNIPTEELDKFANTLDGINWQETSVEELSKKLQQAGVDISKLSDEALKQLIDSMDGALASAANLASKFSELHSVIDGLSDGDSIKSDDYDKLSSEYRKYFQLQLDGTYKLMGAAKDLQKELKQDQIKEFKGEIENLGEEIQRLEGIKDKNYDFDNLSQTDYTKNEEGAEYAYTYNEQHAQEQLEFLQEFSQGNAELQKQIETWQADLADGSVDDIQVLKDIANEVENCRGSFEGLDTQIQEHLSQQYEMQLAIAGSAEDMKELKGFLDDGTISAEAYTAAALEMDRSLDLQNLDPDELEDYADYLQEAAANMEGFNDEMSDTEAEIVAKGIMKMNRAMDTLADNFSKAGKKGDSWRDILEQSTETSEEYAEAMIGTKKAVGELLDISSDFVSNDFVKEHLEDIEKAATGDADAIDNLKAALADDIIVKIISDNADFITDTDAVMNAYNELKASIPDIEVGVTLDGEDDFVTSLQNLIDSTGMTVDQVNALCDALGFEAQYESSTQPTEYKVPLTTTQHTRKVTEYDGHGNPTDWIETEQIIDSELKDFKGAYTAFAISTNGKSPKISGLSKKATGSSNNYSSQNKGGKSPGKSKGKKGGSKKTPEHKHKEKVDKFEADPFHKVNQELEDVEHNLKMIDKQQSHVFGKELINNLKQQNAQLKKQNKLHKKKLDIAKKEAKILRNKLKAEGAAFDGDNIANYNAMLRAAEKQINALIKQYNSLSAAEQEAYDKAYKEKKSPIEKAEEYYEKLKKQMDKYTNYMSTVYSEEEAMQDALFQRIENHLKAYQAKIEVKLDMSEARKAMNKFLKDMSIDIKNKYKTSAEWATIFETSKKDAKADKDDINTKLKQLEAYKNASVGGAKDMFATESEKYKAITDLEKEILEDSNNLLNEYQTAYDNLRDAFGEVADQFNEILDQFDSINDTLDHYAKVIELLYGGEADNGREQLAELYSLQKENSLARQDAMRKWDDELQKRRAGAIANGYDEDDSYIKDIDAQIEENSKNLESEIENYIDTIQRELENSIKMAQSQMDKSIWGASMVDARQEWDDKKAMADGYYDSVERIYQLESLESKWKAAITNTSSLKAQQQLAAIMDKQVASLKNKNTLSEKDIELAEKELAVYQAQIALEEAQNNKNSMKLTRDETGNWSYQYVADEDDIADKQQNYLDKINEWRTASINAAEEITEKTMDAYEAFSERMTEIMNDVTLSEEERDAKIAELNATYWGEDGIITKLVEDSNYIQSTANRATYTELWSLYEQDAEKYKSMTETEKGLIDAMVRDGVTSYEGLRRHVIGDDGESGIYGEIYDLCKRTNEASSAAWKSMAADAINRMYKDPDSVSKTVKQAYVDMEGALKIYNKAIEKSEKASGVEWSKVGLQLDKVQKKIKKTAKRVDDFTSKLKALSAFEKAVLKIKEMWDKTSGSIKKATSDLEKYYKLLAKGKNKSTGGKSKSTGGKGNSTGGKSNSTGGGGNDNTRGGGAGSSSGGDGKLTVGETVTYTGGTYYHDSYGTAPSGSRGAGKKVKITSIKEDGRPYPIHVTSKDSAYGWLAKDQLSGYDTGGYTGDWAGGDGRLALLHSKELVLNKDDTKNILDTVQILRQFATKDLAQLVGDAISHGLSSLIGKALNFDSNNYDTTQVNNNTNEEQNVTINVEAVFPHADDINEIREAILSLPNYASQFKMRK